MDSGSPDLSSLKKSDMSDIRRTVDYWTSRGMKTLHRVYDVEEVKRRLSEIDEAQRFHYLTCRDKQGRTALHSAAYVGRVEVADLIIRSADSEYRDSVIYCVDDDGETPLHNAQSSVMAQILLDRLTPATRQQFIKRTNKRRDTAVTTAIWYGRQSLLEFLWSQCDTSTELDCLQRPSTHYEDSLLMAAGLMGDRKILTFLLNKIPVDSWEEIVTTANKQLDVTLTQLLVLHQMGDLIAQVLKPLSLDKRRAHLALEVKGVFREVASSPFELALKPAEEVHRMLFRLKVVSNALHWVLSSYYDNWSQQLQNDVLKVLHLLTNEYFLTYPVSIIRYTLPSVTTISPQLISTHTSALTAVTADQLEGFHKALGESPTVVLIDWEIPAVAGGAKPSVLDMVKIAIRETNQDYLSGKPKVVITQLRLSGSQHREAVDYKLQTVSLPADYLLWCVVTTHDLRSSLQQEWMEFCQLSLEQSLDHLYKYLKANPSVISCSVSTSLGRRLGSPSNNLLQLTGSVDLQPGSALIICNSKTQLEYESELDYVQDCLHRQLRLEERDAFMDESADTAVAKIIEFSAAGSSSRLLVLAVMCHGDGHDNMLFVERRFTADDLIRELDEGGESPPNRREENASPPGRDALRERLQQLTELQESTKHHLLDVLSALSDEHELMIRARSLKAREIIEQLNKNPDVWRDEMRSSPVVEENSADASVEELFTRWLSLKTVLVLLRYLESSWDVTKDTSGEKKEPGLLLVDTEEALNRIRQFVSDDSSNRHLLMSLLSSVSRQKTVMMTTTPLSVQDIVDALDNGNKSQPKVIILQYCRGSNTGRTKNSGEELKALFTCKRMTKLPANFSDDLLRTGAPHSWRTVALPDNYYVVFSTLSDSKSLREMFFRSMFEHLEELAEDGEDNSQPKCVEIEDLMTDVAGRLRDETVLCQHVHRISTLTDKLYLSIYPM